MSSCLIARLNELKSKADTCGSEELLSVLEEALDLADKAITDLVATELAIDELLKPSEDFAFYGDEGIK